MRELTELQKEQLLKELPDTEQGLISYGLYAKKEMRRLENKARNLEFLLNYIKDKFPNVKF